MKTITLIVTLSLFPLMNCDAGNDIGTIILKVTNIQVRTGAIHLVMYNKSEGFLKENEFLTAKERVTDDDELVIVLKNVPFGEYAISIFHDENDNEEMDMFLGIIPKEAYGFSNNARGNMGPPSYDQSKFNLNEKELKILITVDK